MPNIYEPSFEEGERPAGFRPRRARIGYELSTELIGCSLWDLPPGEAAYPYHYHYSDEELVIVLSGRPTLRTPEGNRELEQGETLRFELGEEGAHQIFNATEETVTFSPSPATAVPTSSSTPMPTRSASASASPKEAASAPSSSATTPSATSTARAFRASEARGRRQPAGGVITRVMVRHSLGPISCRDLLPTVSAR